MSLLGRAFSTVRLLKDTFVIARETTFAGGALFGTDTLHLEATTDSTGARGKG